MWKDFNPDGTLAYGNFLETVTQLIPFYMLRAIGGFLYIIGMILLIVNVLRTVATGKLVKDEEAEAPALEKAYKEHGSEHWHRWIERNPIQLTIWSLVVILIGGIVEFVPTAMVKTNIPTIESVKPYTALELEGRDIYIREGCNACHSQMVRPFRSEVVRYDPVDQQYSMAGEFVYDHPFLWGSKRTGPDLHRVGNKYPHSWHYNHMWDPTSMSPGSLMPRYTWLFSVDGKDATLNTGLTQKKLSAMKTLGVPYSDAYIENWERHLNEQAKDIAAELNQDPNITVDSNEEIVALIAYLQRLGTDIKNGENKYAENTIAP